MSQRSRSTYQRYYMPVHLNQHVQAVVFGMVEQKDMVRIVGQRDRDAKAPKCFGDLSKAQKAAIINDPTVLGFQNERDNCKEQIYALGFDKIHDAAGKTEWYNKYIKANARLNAKKAILKERALNITIAEYHKNVDTIEINNQLKGIMPNDDDILNPPNLKYELEDRAMAARLFYQPVEGVEAKDIFCRRIDSINCLTRLCGARESPRWYRSTGNANVIEIIEKKPRLELEGLVYGLATRELPEKTLGCAYCWYSKEKIGLEQRYHEYPRFDNLAKHIERLHFKHLRAGEVKGCGYPCCTAAFGSSKPFLNHAERTHHLREVVLVIRRVSH